MTKRSRVSRPLLSWANAMQHHAPSGSPKQTITSATFRGRVSGGRGRLEGGRYKLMV